MGPDLAVIVIIFIIAIPIFFICRQVFKKIKNKGIRQLTSWLATIVLAPLVYVGLISFWLSYVTYYPERDFDKEKWKIDIEKRYEMADDLIDNDRLIGKTKDEITDLLGQEEVNTDSTIWTYYIGFKPSIIAIDPDVLEIEFKDGFVIKCWTRRT